MKIKYFIFGGSSEIAINLIKILKGHKIICISSKKINLKIPKVKFIQTDYSKKHVHEILSKNVKKLEKSAFLFFNGISEYKAFYKLNQNEIKKIININFILPIIISNIIIKDFFSPNLHFIYFSSSRALKSDRGISIYSSTKNAIKSFCRSLAFEYGNMGLNFRVISLGLISGGLEKNISKKIRENILNRSSIKKKIKINELKNIIQFIITDKTGNGSTLKCDNGYI